MSRFYGGHPGTRQDRSRRTVKPATPEERLESIRRELQKRMLTYGSGHPMVCEQQHAIAMEKQQQEPTVLEIPTEIFKICTTCPHFKVHGHGFKCSVPIRHCHSKRVAAWRKENKL